MKFSWAIAACAAVAAAYAQTDWPYFGHDPGGMRYSPLKQIDTRNVGKLQRAWTAHTGAKGSGSTPIVVNGVMYLTADNGIFALQPETGKIIWHFEGGGIAKRGLAYWPGDRQTHPRVYAGMRKDLIAIDTTTGKLAPGFGNEGKVDFRQGVLGDLLDGEIGLQSPPSIYRGVLITGSSNGEGSPSTGVYGDIRGW